MSKTLKSETLHGVQPTKVSEYILNTSQIPLNKNCTSEKNPINCSVRHYRQNIVDSESILRGLDRQISKNNKSHSY